MRNDLNPAQKQAVEAEHETPLLIVAGAGTGKTKTLTARVAHLIASGVPPERICAITFTNKAAREMAERVSRTSRLHVPGSRSKRLPERELEAGRWKLKARSPYIGTFHAFGASVLRGEARRLGRTASFVIYDDHDSMALLKRIWKGVIASSANEREITRIRPHERERNEREGPAYYRNRISAIKNGVLTRSELARSRDPRDKRALIAYDRYEASLEKNNALDFDDLIEKVVRLWTEHPATLAKYEKLYPYLLVDEYQDINRVQYEFIRLLAGRSRKLSVVGDDQQLIYGWRYASLELFLGFENDWPGTRVVTLEENYRSTSSIISAASAVIANNRRQKPKALWTKNPDGKPIRLVEAGDEEEEAAWIAEQVAGDRLQGTGRNSGTTAVLYRTNAQSRPIEQALIERGMPYRIYGGLKFYERKEVKDLLAALRLAANAKDDVSRERWERGLPRSAARALDGTLPAARTLSPAELLAAILEATDYFGYLTRNYLNADERKENVAELVRFAAAFDDLDHLLERAALLQATDDTAAGLQVAASGSPVHLSTIHLAKGLEFDRVFVAGVSEGLLPHAMSLRDAPRLRQGYDGQGNDALEEERRLMYVAMTRARRQLALTFSDIPSRFLSEIPRDLLRYENLNGDASAFDDGEERYITLD